MRHPVTILACAALPAAVVAGEQSLARYAQGVFAELHGRTGPARAHYEAVRAADPASFQVARKASAIQLADGDPAAARATLREFAAARPGHLGAQLHYADFLDQHAPHDAGARRAAEEVLEAADQRFPHHPEVFSRLINAYENRSRHQAALAVFHAQFELGDAGPAHWLALAPIARTLLPGDSPELRKRLDLIAGKAVESGIALPAVARFASDHFRATGRLDRAIEVLARHVEAAPNSLTERTRLGLLLLYAKRDDEALAVLHDVLRIDPDQVLAHRSLAAFHERRGTPAEDLFHRAEILRIAGGEPADFLEVAARYLELNQPHRARVLLEKARFDHPAHAAIAARLAVATRRDGDPAAAARQFRQAEGLAGSPDDPAAATALDREFQLEFAMALRATGQAGPAEDRLRRAIRATTADQPRTAARALRELASLWLAQDKNRGPAVSLLERAASLDPGNPETKALLRQAAQAANDH